MAVIHQLRHPLAPALKESFPEVIYASRYEGFGEPLFRRGDKAFYENAVVVVDPNFFNIFSFPFLKGDPSMVMEDIYSIVITEQIVERHFPGENPIGKVLNMNDEIDFTVRGVMQNVPPNSTLMFDIPIHFDIRIAQAAVNGMDPNSWGWWSPNTFLKLQKDVSMIDFNQKITKYFQSKFEKDEDDSLSVLPLTERRFFFWNMEQYITIFSIIGIFTLFVACINFINLSTARSSTRAKEIGIRKVAGAFRKNLIFQFLGESFILTITALAVALLIVETLLPFFNSFTGKQLTIDFLNQQSLLLIVLGLTLFTSLVSGSYPALIL